MNAKSFISVICEYNPLHFGHRYQLEILRKNFDGVICIMSGDIVQRGSVAVADKYLRAEAAINNGADLVIELPIPYCCSSARDFAEAGVYIANAIGSDALAFGAEADIDILKEISELTLRSDFPEKIANFAEENKSLSYPQTFSAIISSELGSDVSEEIKKPNNILALEYLKALSRTDITPFAVKREFSFLSSSRIREKLSSEEILAKLPIESAKIFGREADKDFPRDIKRLDSFYIGVLRGASNSMKRNYYSVTDDLYKKIISNAKKLSTVSDLVEASSDKIYTAARVRRAINAIVFGITSERVAEKPKYTSVLALNEKGREILKRAKSKNKIEIITKPAHAISRSDSVGDAFRFSKGIEDIISLSAAVPKPSDRGRTPYITGDCI